MHPRSARLPEWLGKLGAVRPNLVRLGCVFALASIVTSIHGDELSNASADTLTLAHAVLAQEHRAQNGGAESLTDEQQARVALLDLIIATAVDRIRNSGSTETARQEAARKCATFMNVLDDFGYTVKIPTRLLSDALLPEGGGATPRVGRHYDCDTGSLLLIATLEIVGEQAHLVEVPDHNFVRLELSDGTTFNWDVNRSASYSDEDNRSGRPWTNDAFDAQTEAKRQYLKNMTREAVKAYHASLLSPEWRASGKLDLAVVEMKRAASILPHSATASNNLAWLIAPSVDHQTPEYLDLALKMAQRTLMLDPADTNFIDTLAAVYAARREFDRAIEVEMTGAKDPDRIAAYREGKTPVEMKWE